MAAGIEELFRENWPLVYGYLRRRTGDPALAEELAQETFYRATRAFLGWRGGSPAAWLLAIARNALADEARRGGGSSPSRSTSSRTPSRTPHSSSRTPLPGFHLRSAACWSSCTSTAIPTRRSQP